MGQELPEGIMIVLNCLLAVTGFLSVFLLNAIWKSQRETVQTIAGVLERLIAVEVRQSNQEKIIDRVERCKECPRGCER